MLFMSRERSSVFKGSMESGGSAAEVVEGG